MKTIGWQEIYLKCEKDGDKMENDIHIRNTRDTRHKSMNLGMRAWGMGHGHWQSKPTTHVACVRSDVRRKKNIK